MRRNIEITYLIELKRNNRNYELLTLEVPIAPPPSNAFGVAPLRSAPSGDRVVAFGHVTTMAFDGRTRPDGPVRAVEGHGEQTPEPRRGQGAPQAPAKAAWP